LKKLRFSIVALLLLLTGCNVISNNVEQFGTDVVEDDLSVTEEFETEEELSQDEINYFEYLKSVDVIHDDYELLDIVDVDLNDDGVIESIISVGLRSNDSYEKYIETVYIVDKYLDHGIIDRIGEGYSIYDVEIIQLPESEYKYIHCKLTNGGNLHGFSLYRLDGEELERVWSSASPTGSGNSYLLDNSGDGKYDGYFQELWSYDVFWYRTRREFVWQDDEFLLDYSIVDVHEYPKDMLEVVTQLISLVILDDSTNNAVDERISEICLEGVSYDLDLISHNDLVKVLLTLDGYMKFETTEDGAKGEVLVISDTEADHEYEYLFMMKKHKGKWHVEDIVAR